MEDRVKEMMKAAEQGDAEAQFNVGKCYANGDGVDMDEAEGIRWFTKAAEQGHAKALGSLCRRDVKNSAKWYRVLAEQGDAQALFTLGMCYADGECGVCRDIAEAIKCFEKAAGLGFKAAKEELALHLEVKRFIEAAEQGDADAQYNLGMYYEDEDNAHEDKTEAVKWYRKAAEQGHVDAQLNLGLCYANGDGVDEDKAEVVKWFKMAAEQGDVSAQYNLGVFYDDDNGVDEDKAEAIKWYRMAAEQGDENAREALKRLEGESS